MLIASRGPSSYSYLKKPMTNANHCVRTRGEPSVLKDTSVEALESVGWCNVMKEMKNRPPDILDFIATVAAPRLKKNVDA